MTRQTPEEFGAAFGSFRRSAFRLELLDRYSAPSEAEPLRRFLAGEAQDPAWREPWEQLVRAAVRDGKQMERVHVVGEPLSDYLRFELTCAYPANVEAGEDISICPLAEYPITVFPRRDFWLFDDVTVALMDYDEDGGFLGADLTSAPVEVAYYRHVADFIMPHSIPLDDYLASLG